MTRFIFTILLVFHGLIHSIGFINKFPLTKSFEDNPNFKKRTRFLWLIACLLFILTSIMILIQIEEWWMSGTLAILFSQTLIIIYWKDAKFGSIANFIILLALLISYGKWNFNSQKKEELKTFLPKNINEKKLVTTDMLAIQPSIVQKWLTYSKVVNKPIIQNVNLRQKGEMRTKENGSWMNVSAEQYFTIDRPGFIWIADVKAAPGIHLYGIDKYEDAHGQMLVKLLGLITVADSKGKETDQGTLLRFLAETIWFPSAALSNYISWEEIDSLTAKATMTYKETSAYGIFKFTPNGEVKSFEALRYYDRKEGATLEKWFIEIDENSYKEFEGIRIPTKSSVTWKLKTGDFKWYKLEVTKVQYN